MPIQLASALLGLSSALVWGAGDFCGGLGARRASVLSVLILAEASGFVLLMVAAFVFREPAPTLSLIGWAVLAGLTGTIGLGALYRGLATGRAGIVAPVSAVVGAAIPALYSVITVGLPKHVQLVGFVIAALAVILASQSEEDEKGASAFRFGILSGLGFGGFFLFIHLSGAEGSTFLPLAIARFIVIPIVLVIGIVRRASIPPTTILPIIILSGILDAGGNVLFLLASTLGRLDVATILSSLYPASTVILSRVILHEKISRLQQLGVILALLAIVLIAL